MQTMRCHFTPTRIDRNKSQVITSVDKVMEKLESPYTTGGNVKGSAHLRKQSGGSSKSLH